MEKKFRLLLLLALLLTAATGAWAEEQVVYTLDGTQTASNTNYANAGVVNQDGITWMVTGNVNQNPWRIGGKDLSGVDRPVWSENSLDETVTKVTLEFGEANSITVNSITMTVAGDAEFSDVIDSKAVTFSANNTVDVTPTEGKEWKNAYYRFVFNVSVSGSSNKYLQLKSIKFYNDPDAQQQGDSTEPVAGTYTVSMKDDVKDADKWTVKVGEGQAQALPIGGLKGDGSETVTLQYNGRLKVKGVKATSDAAPAAVSLIVNPEVGQVIGADGKNYADAAAATAAGTTAVAKICYVGSDNGEAAPYNHGLALALSDANGGSGCKWNTSQTDAGHTKQGSSTFTEESGLQYNDATHNSDTYPAFKAAIANNGTAAPTGCSAWFLASGYQWKKMIDAVGLANLGLTEYAYYWSSSENDPDHAWDFLCSPGFGWENSSKDYDDLVRACLAF